MIELLLPYGFDTLEYSWVKATIDICTLVDYSVAKKRQQHHQWRSSFDGTNENREAPKHRDGKFVFEMVNNINVISGKLVKGIKRKKGEKPSKDSLFKKQSIFLWYLPYWKEFEIGHAIDTMHVVPSICCCTSQIRQMDLVPIRTFMLLK
jgi:hypothetical protein